MVYWEEYELLKNLDYKKDFKNLYLPPTKPVLVDVPPALYATVKGRGNPNDNVAFQSAIQALYAVTYGVKMLPKKGIQPEGYLPLHGLPPGRALGHGRDRHGTRRESG